MSVVDPINYAATLLNRAEYISMEDGPSVLPVSALGRRHSIAVHNDLELFSQSLPSEETFPLDRVKAQEMESSVCDISRKRRTSFCCPVEPGTKAPPRKRRLSICDNSVQEQLIHSSNGSVSYSVPYQEQNQLPNDYHYYRRGSVPNFSPQIPSSLRGYSFGPNSPFAAAAAAGYAPSNAGRRPRQYRAKTHSTTQNNNQQYAGYPPSQVPPLAPPAPSQPSQDWGDLDFLQQPTPLSAEFGQLDQFDPEPEENDQYQPEYNTTEPQQQFTPNYDDTQANYSEFNNTQRANEFVCKSEFPRSGSPDQLFGTQTLPELPTTKPNQSPFEDMFSGESSAFSADSFAEKPKTLQNFPLAKSNLNYLQGSMDDLNANVNVHESKGAKEKEDKKKGLKWTNVTASVTMKYANDPRYNRGNSGQYFN
jgi:hypothetical protein